MYSILALSNNSSVLNSYLKQVGSSVLTEDDTRIIVYDKGHIKSYFRGMTGVEFPRNSLMFMESIARDSKHKVVIVNRLDRCNLPVLQFLTKLPKYDSNIELYMSMLDSEDAGRDLVMRTLLLDEVKHL